MDYSSILTKILEQMPFVVIALIYMSTKFKGISTRLDKQDKVSDAIAKHLDIKIESGPYAVRK